MRERIRCSHRRTPPATYPRRRRRRAPGPCRSREPCLAYRSGKPGASDRRNKELDAPSSAARPPIEMAKCKAHQQRAQPPEPDTTPFSLNASRWGRKYSMICPDELPHLIYAQDPQGSEDKQNSTHARMTVAGSGADVPCAFAKRRDSSGAGRAGNRVTGREDHPVFRSPYFWPEAAHNGSGIPVMSSGPRLRRSTKRGPNPCR